MRVRPKIRAQLFLVLGITLFWVISGAFMAFYKCVNYDPHADIFIFAVPNNLSLGMFLVANIVGPAIGGFIGGTLLVLRLSENLRNKSYWFYIFVNFIYFFSFILVLNAIVPFFFYYRGDILNADNPWNRAGELLLLSPYAIRNITAWLFIAWITMQGLKIYEKYAPTTLVSLFLGRYHRPHEVQRIFMFLDLSCSTTISEKLGHIRFFALLRDFFSDMTDPILDSEGEIYQYVGDEVVISWPLKASILRNVHYLNCFYGIENSLDQRKEHYLQEYGWLPAFKAAIHKGFVVVGEVGVIKREIVYSGDVLNTTARMMEQCNVHQQKLIISDKIAAMIPEEKRADYQCTSLGEFPLRGKTQMIGLFGIKKHSWHTSADSPFQKEPSAQLFPGRKPSFNG